MSHTASWMTFQEIVSVAADRIRDRGMQEIAASVLREHASEACREFARRSEVVRLDFTQPLISGTRLYRLPPDCAKPVNVYFKYVGDSDHTRLTPVLEKNIVDGATRAVSGKPYWWYYGHDRTQIGIVPVPDQGGFDGLTTAGSTTTMTLETGASTTDDAYNDMTVTILSGNAQGLTTTVSDYNGTTRVVTFDDTLSTAVASGNRVQIGREQLKVEYVAKGNSFSVIMLDTAVATAVGTPRYNSIPVTSGSYPPDYFKGCEVRFSDTTTTTLLQGTRTRVVSSYGSVLTVWPELLTAPVNADAVQINSVPNIPEEYHHYLSDFVVYRAIERIDRANAIHALTRFEMGVDESKRLLQPVQFDEYEAIRGGYWDDDYYGF